MKPRFSILTLLAITTYVAVTIAGILDPTSVGSVAIFLVWMAAVIVFASRAAGSSCQQQAFARGFMAVCLICVSAAMLCKNPVGAILAMIYESSLFPMLTENGDIAHAYVRLAMAHGSLALGFLGGYLSVRRYRNLERRIQCERSVA